MSDNILRVLLYTVCYLVLLKQ